jgi:hypothetical protein
MNSYIILEDTILNAIQNLALIAETAMVQQQITDCVEKFNQLGCDYQESWSDEFWTAYETLRENFHSEKGKNALDSTKAYSELQDLSLVFNKANPTLTSEGKKVLMEIDELSKQHISSTLVLSEHEIIERKCCSKCVLF